MTIFALLDLLGGLTLFLFGMNLMVKALEKRAGGRLKRVMGRITDNRWMSFLLGLVITAIVQSSSATTVMIVGFVNSRIMSIAQTVPMIIGANLGAAITNWILSLTGIRAAGVILSILKPTTFTPVLGLAGIGIYMFSKDANRRDAASILLGFTTMMYGMFTMTDAVAPLSSSPTFQSFFTMFNSPVLGILAGVLVTAAIQSSSASIGILQALSMTGGVACSTAIPIIMGQNIGTCITALLSSIGANRDGKRVAIIHLSYNVLGTIIVSCIFYALNAGFGGFAFMTAPVDPVEIALINTIFKMICSAIFMPLCPQLEKLSRVLIPARSDEQDVTSILDERLFVTPGLAASQAEKVTSVMAELARDTLLLAIDQIGNYDPSAHDRIEANEERADQYEDKIGTYLVHLSACDLSAADHRIVTRLLHVIGDLERLSDHAVNLMESAEEMHEKSLAFSEQSVRELAVLTSAVRRILSLAIDGFLGSDEEMAKHVEPLEEVIDVLTERIKSHHIDRLAMGVCTIEGGFVLSDILTNLERVSDHCSNIAICVIESEKGDFDAHRYLERVKAGENDEYRELYGAYAETYAIE